MGIDRVTVNGNEYIIINVNRHIIFTFYWFAKNAQTV